MNFLLTILFVRSVACRHHQSVSQLSLPACLPSPEILLATTQIVDCLCVSTRHLISALRVARVTECLCVKWPAQCGTAISIRQVVCVWASGSLTTQGNLGIDIWLASSASSAVASAGYPYLSSRALHYTHHHHRHHRHQRRCTVKCSLCCGRPG